MNDKCLDELKIYSKYVDLIYYTNMILKKYPKSERYALASKIETETYNGLKIIIEAQKNKRNRLKELNKLDSLTKFILVLVRVSYKNKYISYQNYKAWCNKLNYINKLNIGWFINAKKHEIKT